MKRREIRKLHCYIPMSKVRSSSIDESERNTVKFSPRYKRAYLDAAARTIQSKFRARRRMKLLKEGKIFKLKHPQSTSHAAASLLQANFRGKRGRIRAFQRAEEAAVERYQESKRDSALRKTSIFQKAKPKAQPLDRVQETPQNEQCGSGPDTT